MGGEPNINKLTRVLWPPEPQVPSAEPFHASLFALPLRSIVLSPTYLSRHGSL